MAQSKENAVGQRGPNGSSIIPEIEIGLAYDKSQSTLILEIGKGLNYGMGSLEKAPGLTASVFVDIGDGEFLIADTFARIALLDSAGQEIVGNRTITRRAQHHPIFAERYPFNIQESLLDQITLVITIVNKKPTGKSDRNIGWISFGTGSFSLRC